MSKKFSKLAVNNLKSKYGITPEQWNARFLAQGKRCELCEKFIRPDKLCVDHNHKTGHTRGLLCMQCNTALGLFEEDFFRLREAWAYVTEFESLK